jgi:hypothetical protein
MQFMLFLCADESVAVDPGTGLDGWLAEVARSGTHLEGVRLRPAAYATTVTERGREVGDGPFSPGGPQITGYDVIECTDLDTAVRLAALHPVAGFGQIEVRPLWSEWAP